MTNEFKEKMDRAIYERTVVAKKEAEEYLAKVNFNKQYANLYIELVIAFVKNFDFRASKFLTSMVDKGLLEKFGHPKDLSAWIKDEESKGVIILDYSDASNPWIRAGEPAYKKEKDFDLSIVNTFLAENGITVREDSVDSGGYGTHNDYITFDATALIETRNKLLKEETDTLNKLFTRM